MDSDLNSSFDNYINQFLNLYKKHFPINQYLLKDKHPDKPYVFQAIKNSTKQRNKLQKLPGKWPPTYGKMFKRYRNTLTTVLKDVITIIQD